MEEEQGSIVPRASSGLGALQASTAAAQKQQQKEEVRGYMQARRQQTSMKRLA